MVAILYPPPTRNISPKWLELKPGTKLLRIFDPTSFGATAIGFRNYDPISRFDHQRSDSGKPGVDADRGIIYAGFTLKCCIVEVFGDTGIIKIAKQRIASITLKNSLNLLDLRDSGAWDAGSTAAMVSDGRRKLTQAWSRYFYECPELYGEIDGVIFNNAHNNDEAISLYERSNSQLSSAEVNELDLGHFTIRESLLSIANELNLLVDVE